MANLNNILGNYTHRKMLPVIQRTDGMYCLGDNILPTETAGTNLYIDISIGVDPTTGFEVINKLLISGEYSGVFKYNATTNEWYQEVLG